MPGGQINDPSSGKHYSLPFLPATPSSRSQTLDSPRALLLELQRYKDTVSCVTFSQVPVESDIQKLLTQTLKTHTDPWLRKVDRIELSWRPDLILRHRVNDQRSLFSRGWTREGWRPRDSFQPNCRHQNWHLEVPGPNRLRRSD